MIVTKNATTGSTWFFVNNPKNKFYQTNAPIPLRQIVRASSAAPTYFPPHEFAVGNQRYEFIDGGMSPYNNPSFQLFLEATQPQYNVGWPTGSDRLLLISVGTGFTNRTIPLGKARNYTLLNWATYSVGALIDDSNLQQNLLMSLIDAVPDTPSDRVSGIDQALAAANAPDVESLQNLEGRAPKLVTYRRYTTSFSRQRLQQLQRVPGLTSQEVATIAAIAPEAVQPLDAADQVNALSAIGRAVALEQVDRSLFEKFL